VGERNQLYRMVLASRSTTLAPRPTAPQSLEHAADPLAFLDEGGTDGDELAYLVAAEVGARRGSAQLLELLLNAHGTTVANRCTATPDRQRGR
jgi:hypothetical protein